jgi:GTPase
LGVSNGKIIADIPGLIEGASRGKGLGIKFLKHIEKVSLLLHCISVESEDPEKDYLTVTEEIAKYNKNILLKKTVILLTKADLTTEESIKKKAGTLTKYHYPIIPLSIYRPESIAELEKILI